MEPWKSEPTIWDSFCYEKGIESSEAQRRFEETKGTKEQYEWFHRGYSRGKGEKK
jgi:hypothetical protein